MDRKRKGLASVEEDDKTEKPEETAFGGAQSEAATWWLGGQYPLKCLYLDRSSDISFPNRFGALGSLPIEDLPHWFPLLLRQVPIIYSEHLLLLHRSTMVPIVQA